ncbi:putative Tetratricopeptide repeat-like superfamily protein [Hibiscus syriacus]|uniref:Tetratricopeptide repeat-like superfamily protein n=1 Tax=Hibiscus syriacus TaxID=106335 RepID=A0A6A3A7U2_HIBSY|nr:putative Tetratricopeptide repeat-like superfamily protein [Hibiscus syriacus]
MGTVSQLSNFPCKTFFITSQPNNFSSKLSVLPPNTRKPTQNLIKKSQFLTQKSIKPRPVFHVRASDADDEWGLVKEEPIVIESTDVAVAEKEKKPDEVVEIQSLKKTLAKNPTPAPTEALPLLNGKWILAYTSFPGMFPLLSRGQFQLVKAEDISQIDAENLTVQNSVQFFGPLTSSSISTNAKFEVRSPKRVLDTASSVAKTISSQPPLKIPLSNSNAELWLLTTYLDDELRISRGDAGSVIVLIK